MLITDTMVDAVKPSLQIGEGCVDNRQKLFGNLRVAALGDGCVPIPSVGEVVVTFPVISNNKCVWHNRLLNEAAKRFRAPVGHNGEPYAPGVTPALPLVELGARLALANFNSTSHNALIVDATAFAACPPADISLICLDVLIGFAANPVLSGPHHAGAELVEDLECRLIAGQPKLSLKLHRRYSRRLTGNQIGSPEPDVKRRMRTLHHSPRLQAGVSLTFAASKHVGFVGKPNWLPSSFTMRTHKSARPTQFLQVSGTGINVGEKPLELWKGVRERQVVTLMYVH